MKKAASRHDKLKPGMNEVVVSDIDGTKQQLKLIKVFYFRTGACGA